jgi:hypothetical protein
MKKWTHEQNKRFRRKTQVRETFFLNFNPIAQHQQNRQQKALLHRAATCYDYLLVTASHSDQSWRPWWRKQNTYGPARRLYRPSPSPSGPWKCFPVPGRSTKATSLPTAISPGTKHVTVQFTLLQPQIFYRDHLNHHYKLYGLGIVACSNSELLLKYESLRHLRDSLYGGPAQRKSSTYAKQHNTQRWTLTGIRTHDPSVLNRVATVIDR